MNTETINNNYNVIIGNEEDICGRVSRELAIDAIRAMQKSASGRVALDYITDAKRVYMRITDHYLGIRELSPRRYDKAVDELMSLVSETLVAMISCKDLAKKKYQQSDLLDMIWAIIYGY